MILIQLLFIETVLCSGISVHLSVVNWLADLLPQSFSDKTCQSYMKCGSFFPDAYYNCFALNDAAEDAHWPPFLYQSIGTHFEHGNGSENANFKCFMYGIFTHQLADSTWHSLRMENGLLKHLTQLEFFGDTENAHLSLDTGGDFIKLYKLGSRKTAGFLPFFMDAWEFPAAEMVQNFHNMGHKRVSASNLNYCVNRGRAGLQLELATYDVTSLSYVTEFPYMFEAIDEYFLGGIYEIIDSVSACAGNLEHWFWEFQNGGNVGDPWSLCKSKIVKPYGVPRAVSRQLHFAANVNVNVNTEQIGSQSPLTLTSRVSVASSETSASPSAGASAGASGTFFSTHLALSRFGYATAVGKFLNDEWCVAVGAISEEYDGAVYVVPLSQVLGGSKKVLESLENSENSENSEILEKVQKVQKVQKVSPLSVKTAQNSDGTGAAHIGKAVMKYTTSLNGTESDVLIVGVPGQSMLQFYWQSQLLLTIQFPQSYTQVGEILASKNGSDLVVGCPFCGEHQTGTVFVLDGTKISQALNSAYSGSQSSDSSSSPFTNFHKYSIPAPVSLHNGYENFGTALHESSGSLYVGIRGIGAVFVYEHDNTVPSHILWHNGTTEPFSSTHKHQRYASRTTGMFGTKMLVSGSTAGHDWVAVGAPADSTTPCLLCGAVYVYDTTNKSSISLVSKVTVQETKTQYPRFGTAGYLAGSSLFVSTSSGNGAGGIYNISMAELFKTSASNKDKTVLLKESAVSAETDSYVGFGKSVAAAETELGTILVAGVPETGYAQFDKGMRLAGSVGVWIL